MWWHNRSYLQNQIFDSSFIYGTPLYSVKFFLFKILICNIRAFSTIIFPCLVDWKQQSIFCRNNFFFNFTVHLYSTSACKLTILLTRTDFTSTPNLEASSSLARKTETGKDSYSNCLFHTPSIHLYKICSLMTYLLPIIAFIMHLSSCRDKYKYKKQQIKRT